MSHDRMRGHWYEEGLSYGCACPTPPEAPAARLTSEQLATFEHHAANLAVRPLTTAEIAEYRTVHLIAFPDLWRNP